MHHLHAETLIVKQELTDEAHNMWVCNSVTESRIRNKVHPRTDHEGPKRE